MKITSVKAFLIASDLTGASPFSAPRPPAWTRSTEVPGPMSRFPRFKQDRTSKAAGLWTYDRALTAARALAAVGTYWPEEPFAREDLEGPARLRREVPNIIITGGEEWRGLPAFRKGRRRAHTASINPRCVYASDC
jgi:hypothetical protein